MELNIKYINNSDRFLMQELKKDTLTPEELTFYFNLLEVERKDQIEEEQLEYMYGL